MTRTIPLSDLPGMPENLNQGPVQVVSGDEPVAVILSPAEYDTLVERRGARALEALRELQQMVDDSGATQEQRLATEHSLERRAS